MQISTLELISSSFRRLLSDGSRRTYRSQVKRLPRHYYYYYY